MVFKTVKEAIKCYCLIELYGSLEFIYVCNDEFDVADDYLFIDESNGCAMKFITKVWHYNEETKGFDLVWEKENDK